MGIPTDVESLIADAPLSAHLATTVDDRPHVAPVWYGYRDDTVYFTTGGKKLDNVRRNSRVALSIESARGPDVDWNVTLFGMATVVDDAERREWAESWMYDKYDSDGTSDGHRSDTDPEPDGGESATETGGTLVEVDIGSVAWNEYE